MVLIASIIPEMFSPCSYNTRFTRFTRNTIKTDCGQALLEIVVYLVNLVNLVNLVLKLRMLSKCRQMASIVRAVNLIPVAR
jgi:hypothetical protein